MAVTPPPGLHRGKGQHEPNNFRGVAAALNNIQRDVDELFEKATSPAEQFTDIVSRDQLEHDVGRLNFNLSALETALQTEINSARIYEEDLLTQLMREKNRTRCKEMLYGTVAAGSGADKAVMVATGKCRLSQLTLVNAAALAADGTNNTKLELVNKGSDGTGTTVLATFDSATESFAAFDAVVKPIAGLIILEANDVLALVKTDSGSGAAVTDLLSSVGYEPIS